MRKYLQNPNTPNKRVGGVIVDFRTNSDTIKSLEGLGIKVVPSIEVKTLHPSICGHTDMMIHHIENKRFVVAAECYDYFSSILDDAVLIKGADGLAEDYPKDILYNCAVCGDFVICNTACTAIEILSEYRRLKKKILNVKQGYSKCSICMVNENAIITADEGIARVCKNNGIDVLKINPGNIELPGMNYGFIGGATGLIDKNILAVNGELKTHPNGDAIRAFCKNYSVDVYELKKGSIADIGSILPFFTF